jgi:hypothetical protein
MMRTNISVYEPKFDIVKIIENLEAGNKEDVYPESSSVVFDVITGKVFPVAYPIAEILSLCDGNKTIREIARELSAKYDAPATDVEKDCLSFIEKSIPFLLDLRRGTE